MTKKLHKKNILIILLDPRGGIRKHVHDILLSNMTKNINFHYAHGTAVDSRGKIDFEEFQGSGVVTIAIDAPKKPSFIDFKNIYMLLGYCREMGVEVIHGHGAKGGAYARILSLLSGLPSLYTPHGGSVHRAYSRCENFSYGIIERLLKKLTSLYIFESNYTKNSFFQIAGPVKGGKFILNYNGVKNYCDNVYSSWEPKIEQDINLLVVGILRGIKGQKFAILALNELIKKNKLYKLHLCGDGPDMAFLKDMVYSLELSDHVYFYGDVLDISTYYRMANLVLIPSLFESFGYVALEAANAERPIISSNAGGLIEIVRDRETGFIFPSGDHLGLARLIEQVLAYPAEEVSKIVANAKVETKSKFSLNAMLSKLEIIYDSY